MLKRGMEDAMLDTLVSDARQIGIKTIKGYYYPTAKNNMVRDFYQRMGFTPESADETGNTVWAMDLREYDPKNPSIRIDR